MKRKYFSSENYDFNCKLDFMKSIFDFFKDIFFKKMLKKFFLLSQSTVS